ncbi:MAG: hypothetical protein ACP5M9_01070 [Candidatus Micrarchaeia archaeon]
MQKERMIRFSIILVALLLSLDYASPLLCSSTVLSSNTYSEIANFSSYSTGVALYISAFALLASLFFISIVYIINKIFPYERLNSFINSEYKEIVKTFLIIIIIYAALSFASGLAVSLTGQSVSNGFSTNLGNLLYNAEIYLCNTNNILTNGAENLISVALADGLFKGLVINWGGLPLPPVPLPPPAGDLLPVVKSGVQFNLLTNNIFQTDFVSGTQFVTSVMNDILNNVYFPAVTLITVQITVLPLFEIIGLWILIPLGLILRALPFVREIGGTLLAFGIGIALVWPSMLVLFNVPVSNFFYGYFSTNNLTPTTSCSSLGLISVVCNAINSFGYYVPEAALSSVAYGSFTNQINSFSIAFSTLSSIYPGLNYILQNSLYLIIQVFILLIFDLVIAFTITDNIAHILGGSIRLSVTNKLKLI